MNVTACPGCSTAMILERVDGADVDRCPRCESLWFDAREFDAYLAARSPVNEGGAEWRIPSRGVSARRCPRCAMSLATAGWSGLVLDRCQRCRGLFVEAHELRRVVSERLPEEASDLAVELRAFCAEHGWTLLAGKGLIFLALRLLR